MTLLALFADVPKVWIPGRHLTWSESVLNAAGALAGFLAMVVALWLRKKQPKKLGKKKVVYFAPDTFKSGGEHKEIVGRAKKYSFWNKSSSRKTGQKSPLLTFFGR